MDTQGLLVKGFKARFYDLRQLLNGGYFVYLQALKLIELHPGNTLLDVGCGTGKFLRMLRNKYPLADLYGIEPSLDMLAIAGRENRKKNARLHLSAGNAERLEFQNEMFDWVLSSLTFHHLPMLLKQKAIEESYRVLKHGGRILIVDYGPPSNLLARLYGNFIWSEHAFTQENFDGELYRILTRTKFRVETATVQGGIMHHILAVKEP